MENCLFKYYKSGEVGVRSIADSPLHYSGYGFNQAAFHAMACGYKDGADKMAATQRNYDSNYNTHLLYPIFFCYRQSLELILKAIIGNCFIPFNRGRKSEESSLLKKEQFGHELLDLFNRIRNRIDEKGLSDNYSDLLKEIHPYVEAFNEFDKSSFEMRYACDKNLIPVDCQKELMYYDIQYTVKQYNLAWNLLDKLYLKSDKDWCRGAFL